MYYKFPPVEASICKKNSNKIKEILLCKLLPVVHYQTNTKTLTRKVLANVERVDKNVEFLARRKEEGKPRGVNKKGGNANSAFVFLPQSPLFVAQVTPAHLRLDQGEHLAEKVKAGKLKTSVG